MTLEELRKKYPAPRYVVMSGAWDIHVHFREPGGEESETIETGTRAAAVGGFTRVTVMPNTTPAGDSPGWVRRQAVTQNGVEIIPSACITQNRRGEKVADLEALAAAGACAFTDDGSYVTSREAMLQAMKIAARLDKPVMEHALVPSLVAGGVIYNCRVARECGLKLMPRAAEIEAVRRDIELARETGCRLHIQHISRGETIELIRSAQREGLRVTGEATPHHLLLCSDDIPSDDANWKMAPPLGERDDRTAIREAVKDGTLSIFATDHAPHVAAKKRGGFAVGANGIIGLEVALAVTWQVMVEECGMQEKDWCARWTSGPAALMGMEPRGFTVLDTEARRKVTDATWRSLSRNQPYTNMTFNAWPVEL